MSHVYYLHVYIELTHLVLKQSVNISTKTFKQTGTNFDLTGTKLWSNWYKTLDQLAQNFNPTNT